MTTEDMHLACIGSSGGASLLEARTQLGQLLHGVVSCTWDAGTVNETGGRQEDGKAAAGHSDGVATRGHGMMV